MNADGYRVIQLSVDLEVPEDMDTYELMDRIERELSNNIFVVRPWAKGVYLAGIAFSDDLTDEYQKMGWFD